MAFHLCCAVVLVPVTSHPYDLAVLTSNAEAWLRWGFSPYYNWKFGIDYAALALLAQALRAFLSAFGTPGIVALHIAWKLPLVAADLLSAGFIYRLAGKLNPNRAAPLASLWLVNPVVLWVSAGHGQVESIAVLCLFATLDLALDGRLFVAGLVTGLGAGIEYFPIAAAGAVIVWWRGGYVSSRRQLIAYGAGVGLSLIVCFLPLWLDPVGRPSLLGGLATSGGFSLAPTRTWLAAWAWIDYRGTQAWPFLFGAATVMCSALAWRYAARGRFVGPLYLAIVLVLAVLLDVNALAQFAMIAAAALWLLAMTVPVQPLVMTLVPVAGSATAFVFLDNGASTANAYFFDVWVGTSPKLWPVPVSASAAIFFGHLFSLGLAATLIYAALARTRPSRRNWGAAAIVGATLSAGLVVWTLQPAVWQAALNAAPAANLPDFDYVATNREGTVTVIGPNLYRVRYPEALITAAHQSTIKPEAGLEVSLIEPYAREGVIHATADGRDFNAHYSLDVLGRGYALGFPIAQSYLVQVTDPAPLAVSGAVLRWPNTPEPWKTNRFLIALGAAYALFVVVATGWTMNWTLRGRRGPDDSKSLSRQNSQVATDLVNR